VRENIADHYLITQLRRGGKRVTVRVHRLVLEAFRGKRPTGKQCGHLNGNRTDNRLANLKWITPEENYAQRDAHGTTARGERMGNAKLTEREVQAIRGERKMGAPYKCLAKKYGVTETNIGSIVSGRTWKHVR